MAPMAICPTTVLGVRRQVARVLAHPSFAKSRVPARLLMILCEQRARNGGMPLNQFELARSLGLPSDFDPVRNPLVRMHMSKLRRMLDRYARGDGKDDPFILSIPRNQYVLETIQRAKPEAKAAAAIDQRMHRPTSNRVVVLIVEFDASECEGFPTVDMACRMVLDLSNHSQFAVVGPLLRGWLPDTEASPHAFAKQVQASLYIEGSVKRHGNGLRLGIQGVETKTRTPRWADWLEVPIHPDTGDGIGTAMQAAVCVAERIRQASDLVTFEADGESFSNSRSGRFES